MGAHYTRNAHKIHFDAVVGDRVKVLRQEQNLSQRDMEQKSPFLTKTTLHAIETGMGCSFFLATTIAEVLDCTIDDLAPTEATDAP